MIKIELTKLPLNGGAEMPATKALAVDGAKIAFNETDTKTLILVENSHTAADTITFKAGDGIQGVSDLVQSVPSAKTLCFVLESGAFKKSGCVYVTGATTMKVAAVVLP